MKRLQAQKAGVLTYFMTHPIFLEHDPNPGHPECPERLDAILNIIKRPEFTGLEIRTASKAARDDILLAHTPAHYDHIMASIPGVGLNFLDPDTYASPLSGEAALHAVGAVLDAVGLVLSNANTNAFCAVRPPGHHAHKNKAGGFCYFGNVAIGAKAALERFGLKRVAIVDFDVHHGDGTQNIMWDDDRVLFVSAHEYPQYPGSGAAEEKGLHGNIVNFPLPSGTDGRFFAELMRNAVIPALEEFRPELILVSAGYDAHRDDPLASLALVEDDYASIMQDLCAAARRLCQGRLVVVLEGGYNLNALAGSVAATLKVMMKENP